MPRYIDLVEVKNNNEDSDFITLCRDREEEMSLSVTAK